MRATILFLMTLSLAACGTFRGPGERTDTGDWVTPDQYPRSKEVPNVTIPANSGPFTVSWPVSEVRITQPFSPDKNRKHAGIDFGGARNTPILAAHDGLVVYAGKAFKGYGRMVMIEYDAHWASLYAHLNKIKVKEGQYVKAGETIGAMGRTGHATGVHLHFELIKDKENVDPLPMLTTGGRVRAVLETSGTRHIVYQSN